MIHLLSLPNIPIVRKLSEEQGLMEQKKAILKSLRPDYESAGMNIDECIECAKENLPLPGEKGYLDYRGRQLKAIFRSK